MDGEGRRFKVKDVIEIKMYYAFIQILRVHPERRHPYFLNALGLGTPDWVPRARLFGYHG